MAKVSTFLEDDLIKKLKELDTSKTISKIIAELIDIGYRIKQHQKKQDPQEAKKALLVDKHTIYLLRIMATTADIYRCIRNDKSKYSEATADDALLKIDTNIQHFIDGVLGKN